MSGGRRDLKFWTEVLEAPGRQLGGAGHKLEQSSHLLASEAAHHMPEPGDHPPEGGVGTVGHHRVLFEVFITDCVRPTHQQLPAAHESE